ncbi:MAG: 23S rRNA (uracil(1939)-C(5))-methyltransferase RlmD [Gammaproteobacteria bacterium]
MSSESLTIAQVFDLSHDARGVADIDGRRVFVAGALPGETVRVELKRGRRRNKYDLEALEIRERSSKRIDPECRYFGRCGGCAVQHMSYSAQIEFKQAVVAEALTRIGRTEPERWFDPATSPRWRYRRRARLGARYVEGKGRALVGFRERAASYITDMRECPVLVSPMDAAVGELADVLSETSIARKVPQFEFTSGDDSAALIVRALSEPSEADVAAFVEFGQRYSLDIYLQPGGPGSARAITQARPLSYRLDEHDVRIEFSPTDFIQVNAHINRLMVSAALQRAAVLAHESVLDLFCGVGNFSLPLGRYAREVVGIEGDAGLVARAARNAELNGLENVSFVTADLSRGGWSPLQRPWDVVLLDPPRSGAAGLADDWLRMNPRRIVYVSCHPATLARDADILCNRHRYRLSSAQIFDMFPNTHHVEAMAVFDRSDQA